MHEPDTVISVLPLLLLTIPLIGLLALILGIVALVRINRSNEELRGRGMAIAAIVLGALMLLAPCLFAPLFWLAAQRAEPAPPPHRYHEQPAPPTPAPEPALPPESAPAEPGENP